MTKRTILKAEPADIYMQPAHGPTPPRIFAPGIIIEIDNKGRAAQWLKILADYLADDTVWVDPRQGTLPLDETKANTYRGSWDGTPRRLGDYDRRKVTLLPVLERRDRHSDGRRSYDVSVRMRKLGAAHNGGQRV
jgi:hypothetical protein